MRAWIFRVQGLPASLTDQSLLKYFQGTFTTTELVEIRVEVSIVPSYHSVLPSKNALVKFRPHPPRFLKSLIEDKTGMAEYHAHIEGNFVNIDSGFFGLTQISDRPLHETKLDIVFVTGLDGHAYGSWTGRSSGKMWPRDFLMDDIPDARVMTYGYNTKLSNALPHKLDDFLNDFTSQLELARDSEEAMHRPLILAGHSYGARLITKYLVKCKILDSIQFNKAILTSLSKVVFFGAPHRGMHTDDIEEYLNVKFANNPLGDARKALVAELRPGNDAVERELKDFKDLVGGYPQIQIVSIYERNTAQKLQQQIGYGSPRGSEAQLPPAASWKRNGERYIPLDDESAVLGFPSSMERRIPSDAGHSNITKFDTRNVTYHLILREFKRAIQAPLSVIVENLSDKVKSLNDTIKQSEDSWMIEPTGASYKGPEWLPFDSLYFTNKGELESDRAQNNWLYEVLNFFARAPELKLKSRRFGVLEQNSRLEKVMVEFRCFPKRAGLKDYLERQADLQHIAEMLHQNQTKFSSVPLRGISVMPESDTPAFLFVYRADNLIGLDEALQSIPTPTVNERLWLGWQYAQAIAGLHSSIVCHGLINPYNLYLRRLLPQKAKHSSSTLDSFAIQQTQPMLAGFDVARNLFGASDLIDIEDPDWRIYAHNERLHYGHWKRPQSPEHDVFSLGMVLIVIGLWKPFTSFRKYHETKDEHLRRAFCMKLRKAFRSSAHQLTMPDAYEGIISCCLGEVKGSIDHQQENPVQEPQAPSAAEIAAELAKLLEDLGPGSMDSGLKSNMGQ